MGRQQTKDGKEPVSPVSHELWRLSHSLFSPWPQQAQPSTPSAGPRRTSSTRTSSHRYPTATTPSTGPGPTNSPRSTAPSTPSASASPDHHTPRSYCTGPTVRSTPPTGRQWNQVTNDSPERGRTKAVTFRPTPTSPLQSNSAARSSPETRRQQTARYYRALANSSRTGPRMGILHRAEGGAGHLTRVPGPAVCERVRFPFHRGLVSMPARPPRGR